MTRQSLKENLVKTVTDLIASEDQAAAQRFNRQFTQRPNKPEEAIVELNRYWRVVLGNLPINTTSERECLIDEIEPTDWLRHFQNGVLPTILRFELPCAA